MAKPLHGLVANARNCWPTAEEIRDSRTEVLRTIVYDDDSFAQALNTVPHGVRVIALINGEHASVGNDFNRYADAVATFAARFKGHVWAVEEWNEWDLLGISAAEIARCLALTSESLKAANMIRIAGSVAGPHWQEALIALRNVALPDSYDWGSCLVPDQLVTASGATTAWMRRYHGDVITIETAAGQKVTCTPNHPILTSHGWVPARDVNEGTQVVYYSAGYADPAGPDDINVPTTISEVFCTLNKRGFNFTRPGSSHDFHGDGMDGNVNVVTADGQLLNPFTNSVEDISFVTPHAGNVDLSARSIVASRRVAHSLSCQSLAQPFVNKSHSGFLFRALKPDFLGIGSRSRWQASRFEENIQAAIAHTDIASNSNHRLPVHMSLMESHDSFIGKSIAERRLSLVANAKAAEPEPSPERFGSNFEPLGDIYERLSGRVALVSVVNVSVRQFDGHVYNLSTSDQLIVADGIITHNCHPYGQHIPALGDPQPGFDPGLRASIQRASSLLGGRPIAVTEFGAKMSDYGGTEARQAEYVIRSYAQIDELDYTICPVACYFAYADGVGAPGEQGADAFGLKAADGHYRRAWSAFAATIPAVISPPPTPRVDWAPADRDRQRLLAALAYVRTTPSRKRSWVALRKILEAA